MRAQILGYLALLAPPTLANPLHRRQFNSSSISLTSTGTSTTLADQTGAAEPCIATQIASASTTCEDVASSYGIQLSSSVTSSLFSSEACRSALEAYRICVQMDDTTILATSASSESTTAASNTSTTSTGTMLTTSSSSTTLPATDLTTSSSTTRAAANSTTSSSSTDTAADLNTSSSTTLPATDLTTSSSTGTAADPTVSSSTSGTAADLTTSSSTTVTAADLTSSMSASATSSETTSVSKALTAAESDVTTTSTLTTTRLTTLTFTQGLGASATVKTIILTRVETDFETETVDVQAGTTSGLARSTLSTAGAPTTAPAQVTPDPTSTARVTMFSVSAEAITETKTMTNSYVSDDVTHIEEVIAVQVSTEYITVFTTLTETDVIDPPSSTPMPTLSQADAQNSSDDPLITSDYFTTETELFTHIVTEVDTELKTTMLVTLVHGKNAGVSTTSSASTSKPSSSTISLASTTALLSATSLPASTSLPTTTSLPSATSLLANATTAAACSSSSAPAPTQTGIVSGCTQWHVAQTGDTCAVLAQKYNIALSTFLDWNRAINNVSCADMMAGDAYCVGTCSNPSLAANSTSISNSTSSANTNLQGTSTTSSTSLPTTTPSGNLSATDVYKTYTGDGSLAAGWPSMSQWVSFDTMFTQNTPNMVASCAQWGVPNNTPTEQANLRAAILSLANTTNVDPRFILAIIMQESTGCVRVITTEYSVPNPGLMQSHNGTGTCNTNHAFVGLIPNVIGVVQDPCPDTEIEQMIHDGVSGTASGDGLVQLLAEQGHTDVSKWYRTARMYNGGSIAASGDLGQGCCTACYASDVANRLTGWVNAPHTCHLTLS